MSKITKKQLKWWMQCDHLHISGGFQSQPGWGTVEGAPTIGRGLGTRWSLRSFSTQTILWVCDPKKKCTNNFVCVCFSEVFVCVDVFQCVGADCCAQREYVFLVCLGMQGCRFSLRKTKRNKSGKLLCICSHVSPVLLSLESKGQKTAPILTSVCKVS